MNHSAATRPLPFLIAAVVGLGCSAHVAPGPATTARPDAPPTSAPETASSPATATTTAATGTAAAATASPPGTAASGGGGLAGRYGPVPPNDPSKRLPDNVEGCDADALHCCWPDGRIEAVRCSPTGPSGPRRLKGGVCGRCMKKCLPADARIATPAGDVPVSALAPGDVVFTRAADGSRVPAPILRIVALPVERGHPIVAVTLSDGRRVRGSPGHPTADGRTLGEVRPGDRLDGAAVRHVQWLPHAGGHTHDILPAGPTGTYWADGVLLRSTLD